MVKKNINFNKIIPVALVLMSLSGCSYIKSLFPDKGKDYQYTTEIPPLILPDDVKEKPVANVSEPQPAENTVLQSDTADSAAETTNENKEPVTADTETSENDEKIIVDLVSFNKNEHKLTINVDSNTAWRMVNKALSRNSIEVTNRDQDEKSFVVQYDPDEKNVEDGSLWDEAVFIFGGFQNNEKEYVLKIQGQNKKTDVLIQDEEEKPLPDDNASLKLLTLLKETINADLDDKKTSP